MKNFEILLYNFDFAYNIIETFAAENVQVQFYPKILISSNSTIFCENWFCWNLFRFVVKIALIN